jgi:hypothetical protein
LYRCGNGQKCTILNISAVEVYLNLPKNAIRKWLLPKCETHEFFIVRVFSFLVAGNKALLPTPFLLGVCGGGL